MAVKKNRPGVEPITARKIKHIAGIGLKTPSKLTTKQVRQLAASVEAHIEPRRKPVLRARKKQSTRKLTF
jgi:hypothetical protein